MKILFQVSDRDRTRESSTISKTTPEETSYLLDANISTIQSKLLPSTYTLTPPCTRFLQYKPLTARIFEILKRWAKLLIVRINLQNAPRALFHLHRLGAPSFSLKQHLHT